MNGFDWDLDEMVGAIMADLRKNSHVESDRSLSETLTRDFAAVSKPAEKPAPEAQAVPETKTEEVKSEVLEVTERVIVVDTVAKLAASSNLKTWQTRANAVVTPAARDELAKLGVTLVTGAKKAAQVVTTNASNAVPSSRVTLSASNVAPETLSPVVSTVAATEKKNVAKSEQVLLATHFQGNEQAPRAIVDYLTRNTELTELRLDCMKTTTQRVADELAANDKLKVVIVTHDGAIGSVWANRKKGVRAVVAFSVEQAKRDIAATNANTLIVDPRDLGPYQARQAVDFFVNMKRG